MNKWSDKTATLILESLVETTNINQLTQPKNSIVILDTLKSLRYSITYMQKLLVDLETSSQNDFYLIQDYYRKIRFLARTLGAIKNETKNKIQNKVFIHFTQNLTTEFKLELTKSNKNNVQDMVNCIEVQKNIIISE